MQLKIGDLVIHPAFGVGHIENVEEKQFSKEEEARLYYKITRPKHTMWILVEAEAGGLRRVTAKGDLDQYRALLKSAPVPLNTNPRQRHLEMFSRLTQGSFQAVCEVVRDLTAWGWQKPLGQADTTILQKSRESLYQEWSSAANISTTEAIKEIDALLHH